MNGLHVRHIVFVKVAVAWIVASVLWIGCWIPVNEWYVLGYVEAAPAGEVLHLIGVPGDDINLLLPVAAGTELDESEFVVRLGDPESSAVTTLPLEVFVDWDEHLDLRSFGKFHVPGGPEQAGTSLDGVLEGTYQVTEGGRETLRLPFTLEIVKRGEAPTSGFKDMRWPTTAFAAGLIVGLALIVFGLGLLVAVPVFAARDARTIPQA